LTADELKTRVIATALAAAVTAALDVWQRGDGASNLLAISTKQATRW
jgi:hypothetical protein